ncbi:hypothetical protein JOE27_002158 [Pseudomonas sp. M5]|nr:hypothetical protein [Pseudomonas sp. M5]
MQAFVRALSHPAQTGSARRALINDSRINPRTPMRSPLASHKA